MPLPPLPDNSTPRVWFKYNTGVGAASQDHEVMVRYNAALADTDEVQTHFLNVLLAYAVAAFRDDWRVLSARQSDAGSEFSVPIILLPALAAFQGVSTAPTYNRRFEAVQDTFQGRSLSSGRRVSFGLYRALTDVDSAFRLPMSGALGTALSTASGNGVFVCIDGSAPSWYTYVNQNANSYWESELRT